MEACSRLKGTLSACAMSLSVLFNFEQESVAHSQTVEAFARKRRFSTISNAYVHMTRATRLQYCYLQTDLQRTHDDTSLVIPFNARSTPLALDLDLTYTVPLTI